MGNIRSFATIRISAGAKEESAEWYEKLFNQVPIEKSEKFASFKIANMIFDIAKADLKSPLSNGGCVGYWLVDDLNKMIKKAEKLNGKVYRGPLDVPEIQRTIVQIKDPFGNIIGFEGPIK